MLCRLSDSNSQRVILILMISALMVACAGKRPIADDQPREPTYQELVTQCSKIADRSERDRCLYGN
jgi:hypothetical protein